MKSVREILRSPDSKREVSLLLMNDTGSRKFTGKDLALVVLVAVVTAVGVTLIQHLLLGTANIAVTGGVVGAVTAVLIITMKKKSG